jgi:hypothetical protein
LDAHRANVWRKRFERLLDLPILCDDCGAEDCGQSCSRDRDPEHRERDAPSLMR